MKWMNEKKTKQKLEYRVEQNKKKREKKYREKWLQWQSNLA